MSAAKQEQFEKLEKILETGFTAIAEDFSVVAENFKKVNLRLDSIDTRLDRMESELASIHRRLDILEEQTSGMRGYAKEIDELRARVVFLEKHLLVKTGKAKH